MTELLPVRAMVAAAGHCADVVPPAYDLLGPAGRRDYAADHPDSFLNVILSREDLGEEGARIDLPARAAAVFEDLERRGLFERVEEESFYLYELQVDDHRQLGLVAGIPTSALVTGTVLGHEATLESRSRELAEFYATARISSSAVSLTFRPEPAFEDLLEGLAAADPIRDFQGDDGVRQRLWKVSVPADVSRLQEAGSRIGRLYITDGHHRVGAAALNGVLPGFFLAVLFPAAQLRVLEYDRIVRLDTRPVVDRLLAELDGSWLVERMGAVGEVDPRPPAVGSMAMLVGGIWYRLLPRAVPTDPLRGLDVVLLHERLIGPVFGITDDNDPRLSFVVGEDAIARLEAECVHGHRVGFALHPTELDQLMAVADSGATMPAKSTWFTPKARSGLVVVRW